MAQETMNIALPDAMKDFVLQQVVEGGYSTASEYVRELIRADQKQKAAERLDAMLIEGLQAGSTPLTKKDWSDVRAQVSKRLKSNRK
jgi:antitoxin ParD1/3/4